MKIAYVAIYYYPIIGGVETIVKDYAEYFKDKFNILVLTSRTHRDKNIRLNPKSEIINDVAVKRVSWISLLIELIKFRPDMIHLHSYPTNQLIACFLYCKYFNKKLVITGHYHPDHFKTILSKYNIIKRYYYLSMLKKIDLYLSITEDERNSFQKLTDRKVKSIVLPNYVSYNKNRLNYERDLLSIIYLGRVNEIKSIEVLIEAVNIYYGNNNNIRLNIYGESAPSEYVEKLVQISNKNCVTFHKKFIPELEKINKLSEHSIFVLPSKNEAFGIVLIEAMNYGCIPIGCNSGGIKTIIEDSVDGFLFEPDDSVGLSNIFDLIYNMNHDKLSKVRYNANKKVLLKYDKTVIFNTLEKIYYDVCS